MLQRPRTYQAKTYVPVVSAAIDPYEEAQNSLVDDERLDRWFRYVDAELQRYRSPFVAAEALLTEMRLHNTQLYQPERLYVNSALRILQACVPQLSAETAAVVQAAIHELLPCLVYTRRTPLTAPTSSPFASLATSDVVQTEQVTQLTYAGAFRRMLARWHQFQTQLSQQERHVRIEVKVMDRLVHELDHMWVKTCFYSWRTYCRQLQVRKAQLRRRLLRATATEAAPRFLRAWRQYAHAIALEAKTSRTSALQQEVEALYPLEHAAKSRHDHLSEEIKEKTRLAGESLQRLEETQDRLQALEELIAETKASLTDHWTTWKECMHLLFGDVGKLPGKSDRTVRTDYIMNITDTATSLERRARTKAGRQGLEHVGKLLLYENALGVHAAGAAAGNLENADHILNIANGDGGAGGKQSRAGSLDNNNIKSNNASLPLGSTGASAATSPISHAASSRTASTYQRTPAPSGSTMLYVKSSDTAPLSPHQRRRSSDNKTQGLPLTASTTVAATAALARDVNRVYAAVAAVTRPALSPLHLTDVLHHNEAQLNLTLAFLSTLYSGGHCSLFLPALQLQLFGAAHRGTKANSGPRAVAKPMNSDTGDATAAAAAAAAKAVVASAEKGEEVHWGAVMVQDVSDGMRKVQRCTDANERYLLSVRQCMMSSELEVIQGYLEDLYTRWSITGVPLSRAKLESVWEPIVSPMELPIIKALYPAQGILNFAELVDYVTRVAEFSGRPLLALAERLDATYPYDPLDDLHILRRSEEAAELLHAYSTPITLLFEYLKNEGAAGQFHSDHVTALLETHLALSPEEAAEVCALVRQASGDVVDREDVEWMLLVASPYFDPSPFSTPLKKLASVLEECSLLFAELGRNSSAKKLTSKR